nr:(d)CMP kinase [Steroidobacteraceae bacterium]
MRVPVLTIDGPSGSGKGTIARRVATALGFHLLDSGALYRLVALAGSRQSIAADDQEGHARVARELEVQFGMDAGGEERILLAGTDVTSAIRTETAGAEASR